MSKADGTEAYRIFNARKVVVWFTGGAYEAEGFFVVAEQFATNVKLLKQEMMTTTLLKGLQTNRERDWLKQTRRLTTVAISHLLYDDDPQEIVLVHYQVGNREPHIRLARKMVEDEGLVFVDWVGR
jgi:hypothetical protein